MEKVIRKMEADIPSLPLRKRIAAYARVSSGKDAMLHSLSAQVSYYSEHIQSHPEWEYAGVYVDEALTGTKDDRDGFQRLLADCRAGKIDMVLTKSISRFARNTVTLLETVRELKTLGVDVYFEEQNIGRSGVLLVGIDPNLFAAHALTNLSAADFVRQRQPMSRRVRMKLQLRLSCVQI